MKNKITVALSAFMAVIMLLGGGVKASATTSHKEQEQASVRVSSRFWELLFGKDKEEKTVLIPSGMVFGAKIHQAYPIVTESDTPSVKPGDRILEVDGKELKQAEQIQEYVAGCDGKIKLTIGRGHNRLSLYLTPKNEDGKYRLGLSLRDTAAGIGTITYIDPESGLFGGLGHGITDKDSGRLIEITGGEVTGVILGGVEKGESGKPGELCGILTDHLSGEIYANTPVGVFGRLDEIPKGYAQLPLGSRDDIREGACEIISTVRSGRTARYKAEIYDINRNEAGTKCFKIKVTDPALLAITGGIVKGMSGSPLVQNGKLVGAVTHVMIADPTEGYGIFIENMLSASENHILPKAA